MTILDEELQQDALLDAEIIAYIRSRLPQELQENYDDDILYYFHDLLEDYIANSNLLEAEPDDEGFVTIDPEAIAAQLAKTAQKEKMGIFGPTELALIIEADLSFGDDFEE